MVARGPERQIPAVNTPTSRTEIASEISGSIGESLRNLEQKVSEIKHQFGTALEELIAQVPALDLLFGNMVARLTRRAEITDNTTGSELLDRFRETIDTSGIELTPAQRDILGWGLEARDFWNQHLPSGVPTMPPKIMSILFGTIQGESNFNFSAANRRSSARGLTQFISGTWNGYIRRSGPLLVSQGIVTNEELMNPDARTENPRLMIYMTFSYMIRSYQALQRNGLVPNGWDTPDIAYMLYVCHHHGSGDGPKYLRYKASNDPAEIARIRATMSNTWDNWTYGDRVRRYSSEWDARFRGPRSGSASSGTANS